MATLITKNSSTASSVPTAAQLVQGELAVNVTDRRLFTENASGAVVELGTNPSSLTLPNGTANGLAFLNASKVLTTGSALTFDGTNLTLGGASFARSTVIQSLSGSSAAFAISDNATTTMYANNVSSGVSGLWSSGALAFGTNNGVFTEQMRLTSTGLGIGTSSPTNYGAGYRTVSANGTSSGVFELQANGTAQAILVADNTDLQIQALGARPIRFFTNGSLRATLDAVGNLGLGVTPSNWGNIFKAIDISGTAVSGTAGGALVESGNAVFNGSNWLYKINGPATRVELNAGASGVTWHIAGSGTAGNAISFTQAMTLDAGGRLLVGPTSAPSVGNARFAVTGGTAYDGQFDLIAQLTNNETASGKGVLLGYNNSSNTGIISSAYGNGSQSLAFWTHNNSNWGERARIDSSGNLLVGTTDGTTNNKIVTTATIGFIAGATIPQINYYSSASTIEYVNRNSGGAKTFSWYYGASGGGTPATLSTSGVWTNASDSRGKENIADIHYGLQEVLALRPRQYDVKTDNSHAIGFVAQEVLPIIPEIVHGSEEKFYGLDYGSLGAVLVKAIQEQQAMIQQLQAEVAALKGN